jgi:phage terminase large subunit-like protein
LRDLVDGHARSLTFDVEEASAKIDFWEMCPHDKGKWARNKQTLKLEPWQRFVIGSVYGWKKWNGSRHVRRFRVAWVEMGRKNGKTTLVYPAAIDGLILDDEPGAEVYAMATKKDQSKIVGRIARRAVIKTPEFLQEIEPYRDSLVVEESGAKFEALGADADTMDGLNPSVVIADEVHKWRGRELWDVIDTATGAREQPIIFAITTAGRESSEDIYGQEHDYTVQVLEGVVEDDSRFGYIAKIDPEDDWTDPKNFIKANPNLGVSVQAEDIAAKVKKAKSSPPAAAAIKRLHLGIRGQDDDAWIPLPLWDAGRRVIEWDRFKGAPCGAGLDIASSNDYAAWSECFPIDEDVRPAKEFTRPWGYLYRWEFWLPEEWQSEREKKLRNMAMPWVDQGWVRLTSGAAIDQDSIEAYILERAKNVDIVKILFDPWNAAMLATHLASAGILLEKHGQNFTTFAPGVKTFGENLTAGRMLHDGNPCARWMADNAVLVTNGAGQSMVHRKKSKNKVDGIVAAVMGTNAVISSDGPTVSYYDTHGAEFV